MLPPPALPPAPRAGHRTAPAHLSDRRLRAAGGHPPAPARRAAGARVSAVLHRSPATGEDTEPDPAAMEGDALGKSATDAPDGKGSLQPHRCKSQRFGAGFIR